MWVRLFATKMVSLRFIFNLKPRQWV